MSGPLILLTPLLLSVVFGGGATLAYVLRGSTAAVRRWGGFLYAGTLTVVVAVAWADVGLERFLASWGWRSGSHPATWVAAWILVAGAAGTLLFRLELLGSSFVRRRSRPDRGRERTAIADRLSVPAFLTIATMTVLAEEFLWRSRLLDWLETRVGMTTTVAVLVASVSFGINHLYFGAVAAAFKTLHGVVWSVLFLAAGLLWVPVVGHFVFDLWVLRRRRPPAGDSQLTGVARPMAAYGA